MISWPSTAGYCEKPQSLLSIDRSEWQRPQCSTATSTSSSPNGPSSTSCLTSLLLAAGATHASILVIVSFSLFAIIYDDHHIYLLMTRIIYSVNEYFQREINGSKSRASSGEPRGGRQCCQYAVS